jgi:WD40 repeat protein
MPYEVFVSYAHQDKSTADAACALLEREGIRCWIAPRDIEPGADWGAAVINAIKSCRAVVLVFSAAANTSPQILREVERAVHLGVPVIPVRLEDVVPEGALEYHLGTVHWLDAMTPPLEAHLHRLADALLLLLNREKQQPPSPAAASATTPASVEAANAHRVLEWSTPNVSGPQVIESPKPAAVPLRRSSKRTVRLAAIALLAVIAVVATVVYFKWFKVIDPKLARTFIGHTENVRQVAFTPDSAQLASASDDNTVKLWEVATGEESRTFFGHSAYVCCVAVSPDGQMLASGDISGAIKLWDIKLGQEGVHLTDVNADAHKGVDSVAFSPDGRRLAAGYDDQDVRIWDVTNGELKQTIVTGQHSFISNVAFSPDGRWLASGSGDGSVKVWDLTGADGGNGTSNSPRAIYQFDIGDDIHGVAFSPDGKLLAVGSYDQTVTLWNTSTGEKVRTMNGNASYVHAVAFSPDGRWLISGTHDNAVQVWEVATGKLVWTLAAHKGIVFSVAFSPNGRYFASAGGDNNIKLWSTGEW